MSADAVGPRSRLDAVAAAEVDPVLWDMSSELVQLRRQLAELRRTLEDRERQLGEARQGSEVSERAVATLKGVLTDMVLKGRAELRVARDEATRSLTERVAAAQAEAEVLVADATAALTTALGRPSPKDDHRPAEAAPANDGPPPAAERPWPTDAIPLVSPPRRLPETPWPSPSDLPAHPHPLPPVTGEDSATRSSSEGYGGAAMNGWAGSPSSVQILDPDLDRRFEAVVGLQPNTEFRTPPRGTPVVTIPPPPTYDAIATSVVPPVEPPRPGASRPLLDDPSTVGLAPPAPPAAAHERLHFGALDALLPIIAVILVVLVVLSWLG